MPRGRPAGAADEPPTGTAQRVTILMMRVLIQFFRANPQALALALICLILGVGTFIAVLVALAQSGGGTPSGEPDGVIMVGRALLG